MDQPMVGDHWTYEVHDEITGTLKNTYTETITDITPTEISVRSETVGGPSAASFVYDNLWNIKNGPVWKFTPGDGTGVKLPLKVGSTWKSHDTALFQGRQDTFVFQGRSATEARVSSSKVEAEETITTDAGTFHTFKIETVINAHNINNPTKKYLETLTSWYAPSIDHWVKRTTKVEENGHITQNLSLALVDCGRR